MESEFDVGPGYADYQIGDIEEIGPHTGRREGSSDTGRFLLWSLAIMMAICGLIGVIVRFAG